MSPLDRSFSLRFRKAFAEEPCHANPGQVVPQGPCNCERAYISKKIFFFLSVIFVILLSLPLCCHCPICIVVCLSQVIGQDTRMHSLLHFSSQLLQHRSTKDCPHVQMYVVVVVFLFVFFKLAMTQQVLKCTNCCPCV